MKRKAGEERSGKRRKTSKVVTDGVTIREGEGCTHLQMLPGQAVVFSGSAQLEVMAGCLQVYGAQVTSETGSITVHAPSKLGRALLLSIPPAEAQVPRAQLTTAVQAKLQALAWRKTAGMGSGYAVIDASSSQAPAVWQVPEAWAKVATSIAETAVAAMSAAVPPPVIVITGCKGSGKSSLGRLLVNQLLSCCEAMAYMDLDPGQPELTPPGLLSLHVLQQPLFGPAHLQQRQPLLAYFLGDVSSQSDPGRYLQAVQALFSRYYSWSGSSAATGGDYAAGEQDAPAQMRPSLVVNTPGWITGLGLELLAAVLQFAAPTHVVNLLSPTSKRNLPGGCWWLDATSIAPEVSPALLQLPSISLTADAAGATSVGGWGPAGVTESYLSGQSGDTANISSNGKFGRALSAIESRSLMWLSWAQRLAKECSSGGSSTNSNSPASSATAAADASDEHAEAAAGLAAAIPYQVPVQDVQIHLLHAQVSQSELPTAINGSLVGLVCSAGGVQKHPQHCLGIGLIRAIDARKELLYLLTELPEEQLQQVDTLVVGKLELPDKLQATQQFASPYQGLYCLTSTATGAGMLKSRNNLLRTSLLQGA